jgi:hypothetical protein
MTRLVFIFLAITACGGGGGGGDDTGGSDGGGGEPLVNGEPASQYYGRFAFQTIKTGVEGAAAFPAAADGRNAYLVAFFLLPNNQLELFYAEGEGEVSSTGWSLNIFGNAKKRRSGTWRVDGAKLVLDSFMSCDGLLFNDKPALRCTLSAPILTADAQGRSGTFQRRLGESSPDDSEFADYVP